MRRLLALVPVLNPCIHRRASRCAPCRMAAVNGHDVRALLAQLDAERTNLRASAKRDAADTKLLVEHGVKAAG